MRISYSLDFTHLGLDVVEQRIANFIAGPDGWEIDDAQMYQALLDSRAKLRAKLAQAA